MTVYLPTAVVGNDRTLITLGASAEIMGWFYPAKDHAQQIHQCLPCVYIGPPHEGRLSWTWEPEWERRQEYVGATNICRTLLRSRAAGLEIEFLDVVPTEGATLVRQITVQNLSGSPQSVGLFHYGDWNLGGQRTGNALRFDNAAHSLVQSHRDAALALGGDALQTWQCGKVGRNWHSNALNDLDDGALTCQDLEIGDVCWAFGFSTHLQPHETLQRTALFALGSGQTDALHALQSAASRTGKEHGEERKQADAAWLAPGLSALEQALVPTPRADASGALSSELTTAYTRALLGLPLLCGPEGVALAAPEFDFEFESCGGYGYFWPRDGGEYVSGLLDAGYPQFADRLFDWCAKHQDPSGLWHQRYFLNGEPGPNWCLPPDMLQIDQVGAVLWAYGKWRGGSPEEALPEHRAMVKNAADYLRSRLTDKGVHGNAFDTWETFIGSFTYSNAALHAAFRTAALLFPGEGYDGDARRVKEGVLTQFVHDGALTRGFNEWGEPDRTIDSSSLGAIEPFGLLDLNDTHDLQLAQTTLRVMRERLETDWEGGQAIRRFEGDAYVGGVPACVNTLWMARCCCAVADRLEQIGQPGEAAALTEQARVYLSTVLRRATPTGLLPELMQGPDGQRYWAAPHGWAMASFVSGTLMLARRLAKHGGK